MEIAGQINALSAEAQMDWVVDGMTTLVFQPFVRDDLDAETGQSLVIVH
jgi:hypothetical protein